MNNIRPVGPDLSIDKSCQGKSSSARRGDVQYIISYICYYSIIYYRYAEFGNIFVL